LPTAVSLRASGYGLKLVDELGDLDHAAGVAATLAKLDGKPELVYPKEERRSVWRYMMEEMVSVLKRELVETVVETGRD